MKDGSFTIPTYIYLKPDHRAKLEVLVRERDIELAELLSELVASYLDNVPDPVVISRAVAEPDQGAILQRRRAELQHLRKRLAAAGTNAPEWLAQFVTDLEAEVAQLEELR